MDIFDAGRDGATKYVHKELTSRIGLKLAEEGLSNLKQAEIRRAVAL